MANTYTVLLSELVSEFNLDFFYKSTDFDKIGRASCRERV